MSHAKNSSETDSSSAPSFEESLATVEDAVRELEGEPLGLNESLARFAEAMEALKRCYTLLDAAERRVELLTGIDAEGRPITVPLAEEAESLEAKAATRSQRRTHRADGSESAAAPRKSGKPASRAESKIASKPKPDNDFGDMDEPAGLF